MEEQVVSLYLPYPGREDRLVRVFVPAHKEGQRFPVIYMTDGQNLFDEESSTFGCWHTREAVRDEMKASGFGAVIVGVHNEDPWRPLELTPATMGALYLPPEARERFLPSGEDFDAFLVHTVMPAVEARFPVLTGRENTAFCGSSCGGLMSFFTVMSHPELYCAAGVLSPVFTLLYPEGLERWIRARAKGPLPYLHVFAGGADEMEREICLRARETCKVLETLWPRDLLKEEFLPEAKHHETSWEPVFRDFLHRFLTHSWINTNG